ncbi:DoxX family membrane protein [Yoonia sp.]|uniref:DoxX family membrane protein n=1 Tax=Yoonia sp. TaxID=2212373 RepID=UPI001A0A1EEE|nr:DoxX family membrane protein [Yoonia sp.]MBE0413269.1 DoxX family membrane protein [Yoonia sp.]
MSILSHPFTPVARQLDAVGHHALPLLARLVFAGVLLVYYWNSGLTKLGDGLFGFLFPRSGAYAQIFPQAMEAAGYDTSQLGVFHWAVVVGGTVAEFILPLLIVLGLLTRLAAVGMIGFIIVQSLTDLYGHGGIAHPGTLGAWFDGAPDALILDQRAFWVLCLLILVFKGAGALSLDRAIFKNAP